MSSSWAPADSLAMLMPAASVKAPPNPRIFCLVTEASTMISWAVFVRRTSQYKFTFIVILY